MKPAIFASALALLAPLSLQAASPRVGLELFGSSPAQGFKQEMTTFKLGVGTGFFLDWDLGSGHAIRWNLNGSTTYADRHILFTTSRPAAATYTQSLQATRYSSTLDYQWSPAGTPDGWYLLGGLGVGQVVAKANLDDIITITTPAGSRLDAKAVMTADTGTRLQWKVGAGYRLNENWGASVKYTALAHNGRALDSVDFGVEYRF